MILEGSVYVSLKFGCFGSIYESHEIVKGSASLTRSCTFTEIDV